MDQTPLDQSQPVAPAASKAPAEAPATGPIQPPVIGVPAPMGYEGPWPKPGMDGGDPSSWLASYNA